MPYFCDLEQREAKEVGPGMQIRTFWGEQTLVSVVDLAAHSEVPLHHHPHEQTGTVISGSIEMTIAGESRWLQPGDTYLIPGGVEHGARTGDGPTRVMDVFCPVREEYKY